METRALLEVAAISLVIRKMNTQIARRLRSLVIEETRMNVDASTAELQQFHLALAELSGDEALLLFLRMALQLTAEHSTFTQLRKQRRAEVVARLKLSHSAIADAIIHRKEALAVRRMRRYLSGLKESLK